MVPAQTNRDVAGHTTDELLFGCPEKFGIKKFLQRVTVCLMEERVRIGMMLVSHVLILNLISDCFKATCTTVVSPRTPAQLDALCRFLSTLALPTPSLAEMCL